jgi:uroporphyrinogen-III synthase
MKTVLITRSKDQSNTLVSALKKYGLGYELFPTIEIIALTDWSLPDLSKYQGAFFTSVNSVRYFFSNLDDTQKAQAADSLNQLKVYAVGKKTAEALETFEVKPQPIPSRAYATDLMAMITPEEIRSKTYLFVRGSLSLGIIPSEINKFGGYCDQLTVYANQAPVVENSEKNRIKSMLESGKINCIIFTSPSTATNFFSLLELQQIPEFIKIASIGDTTSAALKDLHIDTDIMPSYSTAEGIAEAISGSLH